MLELYCYMCTHVWYDPKCDHCPQCGCKDFMVNDDASFSEDLDGHYEGDFPRPISTDDRGE
jgi:hypothetical protein